MDDEIKIKKIIAAAWRSGKETIGVVATDQGGGRWRAYIGGARGSDEETDAQYIADWGTKLSKREAIVFFSALNPDLFDDEVVGFYPEQSICNGCGIHIEWIKTKAGKNMPVAPAEITIVTKDGETKKGFIPHWSTCPKANSFKKKNEKVQTQK